MSDTENRLVTNLEARARSAKGPGDRAAALCLIIIHYARQGHLDNARADLAALRRDPRYSNSAEAGAWMELASGVIANAACDYGSALHQVQAAYNKAIQNDLRPTCTACAAWLADIAFHLSQVQVMALRLAEVFEEALQTDHHARARAAQTMAMSMFYVNDRQSAKTWFELSHQHAAAEGDQAALGSLFYNTAAYRLLHFRLNDAFNVLDREDFEKFVYESSAFRFYDLAIKNSIQTGSSALTRAQIFSLQNRHTEALSLLNKIKPEELRFSELPILLCEISWANSRIGAVNEGSRIARDAYRVIRNLNDQDDLAYVKARLSLVFKENGEDHLASTLKTEADDHLTQLHEGFEYWRRQLLTIKPPL